MKKWLSSFLSELHREYLKPKGFRKEGKTFLRDKGSHRERLHFQGSSWNGTGVRWRFYLNAGLEFPDLEPRGRWTHFANTHWASRIKQVVPEAPVQWDYSEATDREALKKELVSIVCQASDRLALDAHSIREQYLATDKQECPHEPERLRRGCPELARWKWGPP